MFWGGEVVEVRDGLKLAPADWKILVLSDSRAMAAAVQKAGQTGRAKTAEFSFPEFINRIQPM